MFQEQGIVSSKLDQLKTSPENGAFQGAARQMAVLWGWDFGEALNSLASCNDSQLTEHYGWEPVGSDGYHRAGERGMKLETTSLTDLAEMGVVFPE